MTTYWLKIVYFFHPLSFSTPGPYIPLEFRNDVNREETRVIGLLCGESCMIITSTLFDLSTCVTDKQTGDSI